MRTGDQTMAAEQVIRNAYDQALIRVARLASYGATGEVDELSIEVNNRQTSLAVDDLIHLAISPRRLVDAVGIVTNSQNIFVPKLELLKGGQTKIDGDVPVRTVFNKLVHSTSIDIISFEYQAYAGGSLAVVYDQIIHRKNHRLKPLCVVRADTSALLIFHISALCEASSELLEIAADKASDSRIFLEELFR